MKHTIGILIFGDPTRGGTIASEVKFLSNLYESNKEECDFVILTVNPSVTKRVIREKDTSYSFPHKIITVFDDEAILSETITSLSALVTYPGHSNFFGGYLNDNIVKMYKIISRCTNDLKIPVFIRINDSEIKVRDYRLMSQVRLGGKPESAFMKDPLNVAKAQDLVSWKQWDYTKVYWFANGSKEACDWVAETMYDREDETMRMADRQVFVDNAVYVSDDIFFLVRKNYERFKSRYELQPGQVKTVSIDTRFCYIGFFDTVNVARSKAFSVLFKQNSYEVPMRIFGKGTEILTKLKDKENIDIEEGFIQGDSEEYFDFLNSHLAYIFIGKGQSESRYIGKTAYDAVVARTPIAVYKKCDSKMIMFSNPEYYFEDERELSEIHRKLSNPEIRQQWIDDQAAEIFRKLPPSTFKFSNFSQPSTRNLIESDFYVAPEIEAKPVKKKEITIKAEPLF